MQNPELIASLKDKTVPLKNEESTEKLKLELEILKKANKILVNKQAQHDNEIKSLKYAHMQKLHQIKSMALKWKLVTEEFLKYTLDELPDNKNILNTPPNHEVFGLCSKTPIKRKRLFCENSEKLDESKHETQFTASAKKSSLLIPIDRATTRDFDESPVKTPGKIEYSTCICQTCGLRFQSRVFTLFMRKCLQSKCFKCQKEFNKQNSAEIKDEDVELELRPFKNTDNHMITYIKKAEK